MCSIVCRIRARVRGDNPLHSSRGPIGAAGAGAGGSRSAGSDGNARWRLTAGGEGGVGGGMGILRSTVWEGPYHRQQRPGGGQGEPTARPGLGRRCTAEIGGGDGDEALHARVQPDDAGTAEPLFGGDPEEREREPIEGMPRVNNLHLAHRERRDANGGTVLAAV